MSIPSPRGERHVMIRGMMRSVVFLMAALVLFTAGCGGTPEPGASSGSGVPSAPPAPPRDACALITAEEATKILASPVTATSRSSTAQRSVCDYVAQSFESFTLEVIWQGADDEIKTARSAASAATAAAGGKEDQVVSDVMGLRKVENLGDEAYFSRRGTSFARKGDVLLTFQNAGLNDPAAREHWEALVRAALARL